MRVVFINACHPDTPHVCGLRARSFADALAALGHQVLLVTEPSEQTGQITDLATLSHIIEDWNWTNPCRISTPMISGSSLPAIRSGRYPAILRQGRIALHYLRHSSVFEDWCTGTRPYLPVIAEAFKPDVVWAIFGHTGCWRLGQELARIAGCPWVADKKDPWASFVPAPFRRLIARRFDDAAHLTALSSGHLKMMRRWNANVPATVIYSGIPKAFLPPQPESRTDESIGRNIFLCGSIYDPEALKDIYAALALWLDTQSTHLAGEISVSYAGADTDLFFDATDPLKGKCAIDSHGLVPRDDLHRLQGRAALNLHLYFPPTLFHHKLFELFTAVRPILCYPGESDEAATLAESVGARLYRCREEEDLTATFEETLGTRARTGEFINTDILSSYSWEEQANTLETVLKSVLSS